MTMASSRLDMPSTMIVLDKNSESNGDEMGDGLNRQSRSSVSSRMSDLDPDTISRTPTPSKQVSLTSVRRKEDINADSEERNDTPQPDSSKRLNGFYGDVHGVSTKLNQPLSSRESVAPDPNQSLQDNFSESNKQSISNEKDVKEAVTDVNSAVDEDDSDEDNKAPNQLLMEFLGCVMEEDYENAQKLCKMILLFEPDHPEALKFQPLIEEKLKQEEEEDENSDENTSSDEEEDDDDSSDDSDQSSSGEEDDEKETDQSKEAG